MKSSIVSIVIFMALVLAGCMTAADHRAAIQDDSAESLTLGTVQRKIRIGMPSSDVVAALGSPNIVTTDEKRREVWVYDKIATERIFSTTEGGISTLIIGGGRVGPGIIGGGLGPYYGGSAGAASTTQRTLTVIIRFDEETKVRDFSYHASKF